ncbi:MAG: hypothetical protein DI537_42540 [Stutzerimonas stutzeri]|nr:MAG: hypothetical protein DI537_42540 [Stutzerimonas stutzeri]
MQPLNYMPKAVQSLRELYLQGSRETREDIGNLLSLLGKAEVFVLPPHGQLLDRGKPYPEVPGLMFRPPFPVVALEYEAPILGSRDRHEFYSAAPCPKRIAMAYDLPPRDGLPEGGCAIVSISYFAELARWMPVCGAGVIPYDAEYVTLARTNFVASMIDMGAVSAKCARARSMEMIVTPIWREPYAAIAIERGAAGLVDILSADLMDEVNAYRDMCIALACKNVSTRKVSAPAAINRKRIKSGKVPLSDFHVLEIEGADGLPGVAAGSGTSPRSHLRRGHVRRLGPDRITWVNATIVSGWGGFVDKQYGVKGARP